MEQLAELNTPSLIPTDKITIQNRIRKDYGDIDELAQSIKELGLLVPIIVTDDYILISGERRLMAVRKLGWAEIRGEIISALDREQQLLREIAENEKRKGFTPEERVVYARELKQIARLKAKATQGTRSDLKTTSVPVGTEVKKGKRDNYTANIVARQVGMSEQSLRRAEHVVDHGDRELIDKMNKGEISITAADAQIRVVEQPSQLLIPETKKCPECGRTKSLDEYLRGADICRQCVSYISKNGKPKGIEVDGDEIVKMLTTPAPIQQTSNIVVNEFQAICDEFILKINPFAFQKRDFELLDSKDRETINAVLANIERWINQIKKLTEVAL